MLELIRFTHIPAANQSTARSRVRFQITLATAYGTFRRRNMMVMARIIIVPLLDCWTRERSAERLDRRSCTITATLRIKTKPTATPLYDVTIKDIVSKSSENVLALVWTPCVTSRKLNMAPAHTHTLRRSVHDVMICARRNALTRWATRGQHTWKYLKQWIGHD